MIWIKKSPAPILYQSCVACHRPGEVAPMSLATYQDVRPWARAIRAKVAAREMPPWGADPRFGVWKDDRSLSAGDIDTIVKWVEAGAPNGDDADLPSAPRFADGWSHGDPDVVIEMPIDFRIPATASAPPARPPTSSKEKSTRRSATATIRTPSRAASTCRTSGRTPTTGRSSELRAQPVQPGAGERGLLVGAELGRDVRAAGAHHGR